MAHQIWDVEAWKQQINIRQFQKWVAYYRVEPFGEDWLRTAKSTMFSALASGAKVDGKFMEMFLPSYDPNRVMTDDEIAAEFAKIGAVFQRNRN